jgi:predicted nucleotidyltransferase component of viral defense system
MLYVPKHDQVLKNILQGVYTDPYLASSLSFKGGTCLYMFYGLDRFSVDLDFNLRVDDFDSDKLGTVVGKYLTVLEKTNKRNTWFWLGSYERAFQKVKIEVSKRDYPDTYILKDFFGLTVSIMDPACMFAHKLCAIADRSKLQNRDLYDAHFMFSRGFDINKSIIELRTGKTVNDYFMQLVQLIEKQVTDNNVLDGLGELLTDPQKDSVRATLKRDVLFDLNSRIVV